MVLTRDEGIKSGAEDRAIGATYGTPDETLGVEYATGYYMGYYGGSEGVIEVTPVDSWEIPMPSAPMPPELATWNHETGEKPCGSQARHKTHSWREMVPTGDHRQNTTEVQWICGGNRRCANCGAPETEFPMVFRGHEACSVNCEKAMAQRELPFELVDITMTCPSCRHQKHGVVCLNIASDNDCNCHYGKPF